MTPVSRITHPRSGIPSYGSSRQCHWSRGSRRRTACTAAVIGLQTGALGLRHLARSEHLQLQSPRPGSRGRDELIRRRHVLSDVEDRVVPAPDRRLLVGAAIVLLALNLRVAVSSVGVVLDALREDLGMSASVAGVLTMLPVLCFALFGSGSHGVVRAFGLHRTTVLLLAVTATGIALRAVVDGSAAFCCSRSWRSPGRPWATSSSRRWRSCTSPTRSR